MFAAVAVVLSAEAGKLLTTEAAAVDWVRDAYGHLKAIAFDEGGKMLLDAGDIASDAGVVKAAKTRQWDREPKVRMLP